MAPKPTPPTTGPVTDPNVDPDAKVDPVEPDVDQDDGDDADPEGADQLGDAGKRALDTQKEKWRAERDRRRALEEELTAERAKNAPKDGAPDPERIKVEADRAANARANARIVRSEIRVAAAGKLANPADALHFLDTSKFEVDDDGEVDETEIADAIETLLKDRPYLAAATAPRFQGTGDGGARKGSTGPKQLTDNDLKTMTPEQIVTAQKAGQLKDLLGG